jgi:ferredoxin
MDPEHRDLITFHLTGRRPESGLDDIGALTLCPAVLAGYRDLERLRHDYPLVLADGDSSEACLRSLSEVVDEVLQAVAPQGIEGEALRRQTLRLEREIRSRVARGERGTLAELWARAADDLARRSNQPPADQLDRAQGALAVNGPVIGCDADTPEELLGHLWAADQRRRARAFHETVGGLIVGLSDILRAERMRSAEARTPDGLRASIGSAHAEVFDFEAMARILAPTAGAGALSPSRRERILWALSVLRGQRFFPDPGGQVEPLPFLFASAAEALAAYRERLPAMVELVKAIAVAELEVDHGYQEHRDDALLARFDEGALGPADLAAFPSYLVCVRLRPGDDDQRAALIQPLALGLPMKVLAQIDDILGEPTSGLGHPGFGIRILQLATMALGLGDAYVLQASSSGLFQLRDRAMRGMAYPGPALFSIYSGGAATSARLAPYLVAAAAAESRAFPAFTYDPAAGPDWASRFVIDDNPQPEADWPEHGLTYQDADCQRVQERVAFTFADFVACDRRYARHFAHVPERRWNGAMIPAGEHLALRSDGLPDRVPYLLMVDDGDVLRRVVVEDKVLRAADRLREMWRSLQELGGIHSSHARRLLERERRHWEAERARAPEPSDARPEAPAPAPAAEAPPAAPAEEAGDGPATAALTDEPYIETPRCTSCDECIQVNPSMFAYDDNKQARIVDADAGSYRELIEAAESCQVCIIHPGKPRDPSEPGLEELIRRAEPFL